MEKEWFNKLTEAQKTKLRGLNGTTEELIAFCKEEKLDLPEDVLDSVAGGSGEIPCPRNICPQDAFICVTDFC